MNFYKNLISDLPTLIAVLLLLYAIRYYYKYFTRVNPLPGPFPWVPFLGNSLDLIKYKFNIAEYFKDIQSKYGDFCEIYMGSNRLILISNGDIAYPIHTPSVTLSRKFLYRGVGNDGLKELGFENSGMFGTRNLDEWKINREFFERISKSRNFLIMFTSKSYEMASNMLNLWDILINDQRDIDLSKWLPKYSADIGVTTCIGIPSYSVLSYFNSLGYDDYNSISASERELSLKLVSAVNKIFQLGQYAMRKVEKFFSEIIQKRHAEINSLPEDASLPSDDLLTMLLTVNTSHGIEIPSYKSLNRTLDDREVFGTIRDIFLASFETVAGAMCFVFYYLCKYPSAKAKLISEINTIFGNSIPSKLDYENLNNLPYCDAFIEESLRIHAVFPYFFRSNSEPVEVGGYLWEKEQTFLLHYKQINVNKNDWIDGDIFDPERFLRNKDSERAINARKANNKGAFATFGGGARACPGKLWAISEIKVLLVAVLMRYDVEFANKDQRMD
ncbi:15256_t:CDS:2, partial [Dentiscutata erythropus]